MSYEHLCPICRQPTFKPGIPCAVCGPKLNEVEDITQSIMDAKKLESLTTRLNELESQLPPRVFVDYDHAREEIRRIPFYRSYNHKRIL